MRMYAAAPDGAAVSFLPWEDQILWDRTLLKGITDSEKAQLPAGGFSVDVVPAWEWLLQE